MPARSRTRRGAGVVAIRSSTASNSGTSRPPMYPNAPVTRQRNGDGRLGAALRGTIRPAGGPSPVSASGPAGGAPGRRGHRRVGPAEQFRPTGGWVMALKQRQRRDGQAAGPAAMRWPAAATSAAAQIENPQAQRDHQPGQRGSGAGVADRQCGDRPVPVTAGPARGRTQPLDPAPESALGRVPVLSLSGTISF
jgi:hypothetical protein